MARLTKRDVYGAQGIVFDGDHIVTPNGEHVTELLKDGNTKVGKTVFTWSTLPGNFEHNVTVNGEHMMIKGTCACNCDGCYAQRGRYNADNVKESNAIHTILIREYPDFVKRAIVAQIRASKIKLVRIHASGDFEDSHVEPWREIISACPNTRFWTYTKNENAQHAFDDLPNMHVVPSIILNRGYNFGHCDYILETYLRLKDMGASVYICKCGFDDNAAHCNTCEACSKYDYVLFLEHSTSYNGKADPLYNTLKDIVMAQ